MFLSHAKVISNYKHTLTSVHSAREAVLIQRQRDRTRKTLCSSRNRREIKQLPTQDIFVSRKGRREHKVSLALAINAYARVTRSFAR